MYSMHRSQYPDVVAVVFWCVFILSEDGSFIHFVVPSIQKTREYYNRLARSLVGTVWKLEPLHNNQRWWWWSMQLKVIV